MLKTICSLLLAGCALAIPARAAAANENDAVKPRLPAEATLLIAIEDQVLPQPREPWTDQSAEMDRLGTLDESITKTFKAAGISNRLKIVQFAANMKTPAPFLRLTLQRWGTVLNVGPSHSFECFFWAELVLNDRKFELGTFRGEETHVPLGPQLDYEDFRKSADEAVAKLVQALRAKMDFEER